MWRSAVAVVVSALCLAGVATAPAVAADVRIDLPKVPIDAETTAFTVSGTAPVSPAGESAAFVVVVPRAGSSCDPPGSLTTLTLAPLFVPGVAQVFGSLGGDPVSGPFARRYELVAVVGKGMVCAWLLTQDTPVGLVLGATAAAPIRLLYRLPARDNGFPFIQQTPRVRGGVLTAYLGRGHRFTKFVATCSQHGSHEGQRFTLSRRVLPDPATGAFSASGIARADNSNNYDAPIPPPYHGHARLTVTGRIVVTRQGVRIRGAMTLGGPGLSCLRTTLRA